MLKIVTAAALFWTAIAPAFADDQAILGEFQRGYNFKGKLLRPAWVKVAVHP